MTRAVIRRNRPGGRAWIPVLFLLLGRWMFGCSVGATDSSNDNGDAGMADAAGVCSYSVIPTPLSPEVDELVTLEVSWSGDCNPNPQDGYAWAITAPDQSAVTPALRQGGRIAELTPAQAGTYSVEVTITDLQLGERVAWRDVTVRQGEGRQQTFLLRITPPAAAQVPRQQQPLLVTGGTPLSGRVVSLDPGVQVTNQLCDEQGPFGGYLRFVQAGFSLPREVHVPGSGDFAVAMLGGASYDVMVIPVGDTPAPARLSDRTVSELQAADAFALDSGEVVMGYVEDPQGDGIGQARVLLRAGGLSSSVGVSDSFDGRFILRARPGQHALEIQPPAQTGWPRIWLPEAPGLPITAGGDLSLRLRYHAVPRIQTQLTVVAGPPGQRSPVAGARVTLEATDLGDVGTLTVTADGTVLEPLAVPGGFTVTAQTDAQGALPALTLPAGTYHVAIEAPTAPAGYASTVIETVDITGLAPVSRELPLQPPALLEGRVLDSLGDPAADVEVVAITRFGVGSAVETFTNAQGDFSLDVIRGVSYRLLLVPADPDHARRLLESVWIHDAVTTVAGSGPAGELLLAPGLRIAGHVLLDGNGVDGVLVQAIPQDTAGDPVLAEAVSGLTGEFELIIPDPGLRTE